MLQVLSLTAPVFSVIFIGYIFGRRGTIPSSASTSLGNYVFLLCMPAYLLVSMSRIDTTKALSGSYLSSYALSFVILASLAGLVARYLFRRQGAELVLHIMSAIHSNAAYLGIPLVLFAFGDVTPAIAVICFQVVVVTPIVLLALELSARGEAFKLLAMRHVPMIAVTNPIVIASLVGFSLALCGIAVPAVVAKLCDFLGAGGMPTALFALGLSLAERRELESGGVGKGELLWMSALKICIAPLCAYFVGSIYGGLAQRELAALCLMAGMPTAMNTFLFAQRYGAFVRESSQVVVWTTVGCVATLNIILYIF